MKGRGDPAPHLSKPSTFRISKRRTRTSTHNSMATRRLAHASARSHLVASSYIYQCKQPHGSIKISI